MTVLACPSEKQIKALTLGHLPENESDLLFDHIQNCEECKNQLDSMGDSQDSLVENIRADDGFRNFLEETNCNHAILKAMGALADLEEASSSMEFPSQVGEYEVLRPIGQGGMGRVFLARHTKLGRLVALKVLAAHRLADTRMQSRFEQEMQTIGRLSHPNIVAAHDAREVEGTAVLVTEYIDGLDAAKIAQKAVKLSIADACEIARFVSVALEYTSQQGFVHRDIKPSNVMVSREGQVKLLDLGLARFHSAPDTDITATGQAMGTADYLAPEQVTDSKTVDHRADIYALGCTLFKLLTGRAPFADAKHTSAFSKMSAHVHQTPPTLESVLPDAPRGLCHLVDSMLAKSPDDRPNSAVEVAQQLGVFSKEADLETLVERSLAGQTDQEVNSTALQPAASESKAAPSFLAIATGCLGLLLGFILGVLIVVKYPDGTVAKLFAPAGAQISFTGDENGDPNSRSVIGSPENDGESQSTPSNSTTTLGNRADGQLAFAIGAQPTQTELKLAREALTDQPTPEQLRTPYGRWVEISDNISPETDSAIGMIGSQIFVLLQDEDNQCITLENAQGNLAANLTWDPQQRAKVADIYFLGELEDRIERLTGDNVGNKLAIVAGGRVVSFVTIAAKIGSPAKLYGAPEDVERFVESLNFQTKPNKKSAWLNGLWKVDLEAEPGNTDAATFVLFLNGVFASVQASGQNGKLLAFGEYAIGKNDNVQLRQISDSNFGQFDLKATLRQTGAGSLELVTAGAPEGVPSRIPMQQLGSQLPPSVVDVMSKRAFNQLPRVLTGMPEFETSIDSNSSTDREDTSEPPAAFSPPIGNATTPPVSSRKLDLGGVWFLTHWPSGELRSTDSSSDSAFGHSAGLLSGSRELGSWLIFQGNEYWAINGEGLATYGSFVAQAGLGKTQLKLQQASPQPAEPNLERRVSVAGFDDNGLRLVFSKSNEMENAGTELNFARVAPEKLPHALKKLLAEKDYRTIAKSAKKLFSERFVRDQIAANPLIPVLDCVHASIASNTPFADAVAHACDNYTQRPESAINRIIASSVPVSGVKAKAKFHSPSSLPNESHWLAGESDWSYAFEFEHTPFLKAVENFVDRLASTKGVFKEILEGIKSDPHGPRIDLVEDLFRQLTGEVYIICDANQQTSEYPSEGWLVSAKFINATAAQDVADVIERIMEQQPQDRKFQEFQSAGGDMKVVDNYLLIGDPQMIQLAELRQLKTSAPPTH